jgi:putative FmdB family regulatory protein
MSKPRPGRRPRLPYNPRNPQSDSASMPIYAYKCSSCSGETEVLQKISDAPLTECPHCGRSSLVKQVTAAGFQLKGSGWYATDFKNKPAAKQADAKADPKADGDGKSVTKTETKTESSDTKSTSSTTAAPAPAPTPSAGGGT